MAFPSIGLVFKMDCLKHPRDPILWAVQFTPDTSQRESVLINITETIQTASPLHLFSLVTSDDNHDYKDKSFKIKREQV